MTQEWTGAWRWITEGSDGRPTITSNRYCYMAVAHGREPVESDSPSEAEMAGMIRCVTTGGGGVISFLEPGGRVQTNANFLGFLPNAAASSVVREVEVVGGHMVQRVLGPDDEVLAEHHYERISDAGTTELAGAWELRREGWSGLVIFTDSQYHYLVTRNDRPMDAGQDSPDSVLAELYRATLSQVGAYRLDGDALIATPDIAVNLAVQGKEHRIGYRVGAAELELEIGNQTWLLERV